MDQRGLKTLVLWLIWCVAALAVVSSVYHQSSAWTFIQHDTTHVTWMISGMFVFAVLLSFAHACVISREWFRAYALEGRMQKQGILSLNLKGRVLVERFLQAVQAIVTAGGRLDLEMLIHVEFSAHHRMSRLVVLIGNLLITMGLIGTVLGMTITMSGLHGALNMLGEDQELMIQGLRNAMSGMGVAFYTTLLGSILGGVLLRVFSYITESSVDALQDFMLRNCMVHGAALSQQGLSRDVSQLETSLDRLEQRLQLLRSSFVQGQSSVSAYRDEIESLRSALHDAADDEVIKAIALHRHYAKVLHYEVRLSKRLKSYRQDLLRILGFSSGKS